MNIFHYSVYQQNSSAMCKLLIELIPALNPVKDGKIPKGTNLAENSETSDAETLTTCKKKKDINYRSLVLFWALE